MEVDTFSLKYAFITHTLYQAWSYVRQGVKYKHKHETDPAPSDLTEK